MPRSGLGRPQQAPQKPLQWAAHPRVGCRGALVALPLQTRFHGWVCGVWGLSVCTSICAGTWQENPLNPSPASVFSPFASACEVGALQHPAGGSHWQPLYWGLSMGPSSCCSAGTYSWSKLRVNGINKCSVQFGKHWGGCS